MSTASLQARPNSKNERTGKVLRFNEVSFGYEGDPFRLHVNLSIRTPTRLAILGPNGSGKTTLLKLLGGHLTPAIGGKISWGNFDFTHMPPRLRPTSTVFQDYALFPHYTVRENIEFPLLQKKELKREEARNQASQWIARLKLDLQADTMPSQLSPGVKQRVAIARSLAMQPKLLLLDEPSGALDIAQKFKLVELLSQIFEEHWIDSMVIVTHDLDLAFSVADTVAVLNEGNLVVCDSSTRLYNRPTSAWLAHYFQFHNIISGTVLDASSLQFEGTTLQIPDGHQKTMPQGDTEMTLLLATNAVHILEDYETDDLALAAVVKAHLFRGPYCEVLSSIGSTAIRAFAPEGAKLPEIGQRIRLSLDLSKSSVLYKHLIGDQ
jgi:putative spermidine/putrescine transport system ATP-binding protein